MEKCACRGNGIILVYRARKVGVQCSDDQEAIPWNNYYRSLDIHSEASSSRCDLTSDYKSHYNIKAVNGEIAVCILKLPGTK